MLSRWEYVKLIPKIKLFDPLLEWMNGHCGCVEIVEYFPFDYLHAVFGIRIKKLKIFLKLIGEGPMLQ